MDNTRCLEQNERQILLHKVYTIERKLWAIISDKGLLDPEVRQLYGLAISHYESIILKDEEQGELQEIEYSLWKLHYKHIEEFRKRMGRGSAASTFNGVDGYVEGIKSFLLEATEFYKGLVAKLQQFLGKEVGHNYGQPPEIRRRKFLCHRFLICIGDLARYKELYQVLESRDCDWSVAAAYYLEASRLWPEGGNPHNQLALLATYVGDDFLALYHCVRSLAVKEPFPDAWKNLALLLDESRSSMLNSTSDKVSFDFLNPSERIVSHSNCYSSEPHQSCSGGRHLWQHFVRMTSVLLTNFSLVDLEAAFASTIQQLEYVMELGDVSLNDALKTYRFMNPSRTGPFRAIQAVSVFIFLVQNLIGGPAQKALDDSGIDQQNLPVQYAIAAMFIFMGRLVDRCLESTKTDSCPLLPAVLVFSEWLMSFLAREESLGADERSRGAMSYFFRSFVRLLNLLNSKSGEVNFQGCALWEDYELRGFSPTAKTQASLDFSYNSEYINSFQSGNVYRVSRIIISGMKIAGWPLESQMWFTYDETRNEFCHAVKVAEEFKNQEVGESSSENSVHGRSVISEEEEVILFRPLMRYNSAPVSKLVTQQSVTNEEASSDQTAPSDERLRRAATMLPTQSQGWNESPTSRTHDTNEVASSFRELPMSSGPPSLNAWVLDGKSSVFNKERANNVTKMRLPPIEETLADLSISPTSTAESSITSYGHESVITYHPSPPYSAPVPSAPLLPEDAVFGVPENYHGMQPGRLHSNWAAPGFSQASAPSLTGFVDVYPLSHPMSSSEWLRQFRELNNLHQDYGPRWQSPNFFHGVSIPQHDPLNPWGNATATATANTTPFALDQMFFYSNNQPQQPGFLPIYGSDEHNMRDKVSYGYPRTSPYGCGTIKDDGVDQETLLHYLKQTEWRRLQKDPNLRGPTF